MIYVGAFTRSRFMYFPSRSLVIFELTMMSNVGIPRIDFISLAGRLFFNATHGSPIYSLIQFATGLFICTMQTRSHSGQSIL